MSAQILLDFDGATYERDKDQMRLNAQLWRVCVVIQDRQWYSLAELAEATGDPEASISARLRDLRKPRFGNHTIQRRRRSPGTFEYRLGDP